LGYWVSRTTSLSWLFLPPLHVLAIGLPVLWLLYLAARGLPLGSPQRMWGVFDSGLVLGPCLIICLEIGALLICGVVGILLLINRPDFVSQMQSLAHAMQQGSMSEQELIQAILPLVKLPGVILAVLAFAAVIVPAIEEAIKPIGVWLLAGSRLTPAAGLAAGALSGAAYAFFESLALGGAGIDWAPSVVGRIATGVIHITNTALMGWALALAWKEKRYLNLGLTYLFVVCIHGLWNGLAVIQVFYMLLGGPGENAAPGFISLIGPVSIYLLGGITILMFSLMLYMNRRMKSQYWSTHAINQSAD
jgi:hypothetical protein